jgi:hypothetical protein
MPQDKYAMASLEQRALVFCNLPCKAGGQPWRGNVAERLRREEKPLCLHSLSFFLIFIKAMEKQKKIGIIIDKLTNSIENVISGESFLTVLTRLTAREKKEIKRSDWQFDWLSEIDDTDNFVYKLTTEQNTHVIQGLISCTDKGDHLFMNLIESARFNKGRNKMYRGVAGNLVAFVCKRSFEKGYDGIVSFVAKTQLIAHYQATLGAKVFGGQGRMFIDTKEALQLVKQYYKDFTI